MTTVVNQKQAGTPRDVFADASVLTANRKTLRTLLDELDAQVGELRALQTRIGGLRLHDRLSPGSQARDARTRDLEAAGRALVDVRDRVRQTRTRILLLRQQLRRDDQRLLGERSARRGNAGS